MYEELVTRCHANARNGISAKDIALREAAYAIEELEANLFDGEGVNLVLYWQQQCQIAENGLQNALEELSQKECMILGIMHSVDKWLDGKELEQDEVNRAATMREKTLQIVEKKDREINNLRNELERMKSIMREHGIMTIPSAIPGGKSSWNVPSREGG